MPEVAPNLPYRLIVNVTFSWLSERWREANEIKPPHSKRFCYGACVHIKFYEETSSADRAWVVAKAFGANFDAQPEESLLWNFHKYQFYLRYRPSVRLATVTWSAAPSGSSTVSASRNASLGTGFDDESNATAGVQQQLTSRGARLRLRDNEPITFNTEYRVAEGYQGPTRKVQVHLLFLLLLVKVWGQGVGTTLRSQGVPTGPSTPIGATPFGQAQKGRAVLSVYVNQLEFGRESGDPPLQDVTYGHMESLLFSLWDKFPSTLR